MRYVISLTSIPPRLPRILPVLQNLVAQRPAPPRVMVCLPHSFHRFPGEWSLPPLPDEVEIVQIEEDWGPATKALAAARALAGSDHRLIYCDDDWLYPQGWARALLAASDPGHAAAATGFSLSRLKRHSLAPPWCFDIAQGFSGVSVDPDWLCALDLAPPEGAWMVDDIWLSGCLAREGVPIRAAPKARAGLQPAYADRHALQAARTSGRDRHVANLACLDLLTARYGLWPPLTG